MNKIILTIQGIGCCIILGILIGLCWWLCDGGKTCKKSSECLGEVSNAQELAFKNDWEREDRIRQLQDMLSAHARGALIISTTSIYDVKDELAKLTGAEKPVKIYTGKWRKEGHLEVIK